MARTRNTTKAAEEDLGTQASPKASRALVRVTTDSEAPLQYGWLTVSAAQPLTVTRRMAQALAVAQAQKEGVSVKFKVTPK